MDKIFANTVIYFRKRAHLSQHELALKMGINQSQISRIEEGLNWPNRRTFSKFCHTLGISGNEFFLYMGLQLIATAQDAPIWLAYDEEED